MRVSSAIRNLKRMHGLIAASIFVAATSCVSINSVRAELAPLQPASYLPAVVVSAPDVPLPEKTACALWLESCDNFTSGNRSVGVEMECVSSRCETNALSHHGGIRRAGLKKRWRLRCLVGPSIGMIAVRFPGQFHFMS